MHATAPAPTETLTLESLSIENTFTAELPGDAITSNTTRQVHGALWSAVAPTPVDTEPTTIASSPEVCTLLGLDPAESERPEFALIFAGNAPLPKGKPYAQCYGGHQFGNWAGQLGDGRAISIGEAVHNDQRWELQLKGAGKTPYSRFADGRAVLRSSIREYVASEAFHALGIPTTRALSLIATGATVPRDMFYNGDVKQEPGAVVCRVAPSFVRFGTFQLPVSRGADEAHLTVKVADYVIKHHYPELEGEANKYLALLREIVERTASLVSQWQLVGFVHGVLNTDNMSALGLTIDYGPYGFLDKFDPLWTPNLTDAQGRRYCYKGQVEAVQWNLAQLATAFLAAELCETADAQAAVDTYATRIVDLHNAGMAAKLGLEEYDEELVTTFLRLMYVSEADFTNSFRAMSSMGAEASAGAGMPELLRAALGKTPTEAEAKEWEAWLTSWRATVAAQAADDAERQARQRRVNPAYVPRQHLLQYAIDAANEGEYEELHTLLRVLKRPFDEQAGMEKYAQKPPAEMVRPGICQLSCSS